MIREEDGSVPKRFICPITQETMNEPYLCIPCGNNFEGSALRGLGSDKSCPICGVKFNDEKEFRSNTSLREEIRDWFDRNSDLISSQTPLCGVFVGKLFIKFGKLTNLDSDLFVGKFGTGKGRTINTIVGSRVVESRASAKGVTLFPSVAFEGPLNNQQVRLIDAPGLFDPEKSNEDTLQQLTLMLRQTVSGIDCIFHVIRMGRLDDSDLQMPRLLLDGLAVDAKERAKLAKRYKIIVTHCDSSDDNGVNDTEEDIDATVSEQIAAFRAVMAHTFPEDLFDSVLHAIFIENNTRMKSPYNKPQELRARIVNDMICCREFKASCFIPKLLTDVVRYKLIVNDFK